MLIIKAFVNKKQIDEIHIHNVETLSEEHDIYEYRIEKPEGYEHIPIYHVRWRGWRPLMTEVLKVLEDK
jgi:hypothetical protein